MWCAPTYNMARHGWDPIRQAGQKITGAEVRLADRELWLPNGGRIMVRSTDRPESMRGHGLDFVVLDEAAFMKPTVWTEVVRPMLADRKGSGLFISTPNGIVNWMYDLWQQREQTPDPDWRLWRFPSSTNPFLDPAELEAARRDMGALAYAQEFEAEFVAATGRRIHSDWLRYFTIEDGGYLVDGQTIPAADCARFGIVDPAASTKKSADYTAVACCAVTPDRRLLVLEEWRGRIEGPEQVKVVLNLVAKWRLDWIGVEAVAYQRTLAQYLRRGTGLAVRDLKAATDREDRAQPLIIRMEHGDVFFQAGQEWLADLEHELLSWPYGVHDDQVDTLAYAAREAFVTSSVLSGPLGV